MGLENSLIQEKMLAEYVAVEPFIQAVEPPPSPALTPIPEPAPMPI